MIVSSMDESRKCLAMAVLSMLTIMAVVSCAHPKFQPIVVDSGWNTSYADALSPHTQLALGVMKQLQKDASEISNELALLSAWGKLVQKIDQGASAQTLNRVRQEVEALLGTQMVNQIKEQSYSRGDLMGFMLRSGMSIPPGGPSAMNPDLVAAQKVVAMLQGDDQNMPPSYTYKAVLPEQALAPMEHITLGTALLLARDRESFDLSQIFRLALYFRPLRRLADPNPDINKRLVTDTPNIATIYLDRIWRVLKPQQLAAIREMNLTRKDLNDYLSNHARLYQVDEKQTPDFALIEYVVNDFHEQIAPPNTIEAGNKEAYFIPNSLKRISGLDLEDGRKLFEGICASCHGGDGQGRFPPITMHSYLSLHSDHEHYEIVRMGPPQKLGSPIVMPTFGTQLSPDQIWAIVKYLRSFETNQQVRRGEQEALAAGVQFYATDVVYQSWEDNRTERYYLDLQSDIAYRIMGHVPGSVHIRPEELTQKIDTIPRDKEIVVIDMFGSQGLAPAIMLAKAGYKTAYMASGMMDWHITRNYPVSYED